MYFGGIGPAATEAAVTAFGLRIDHAGTLDEDERGGKKTVAFQWLTAHRPTPPTNAACGMVARDARSSRIHSGEACARGPTSPISTS